MNEKLFNVDYLKHLCKLHGFVPSRKYGQNFLINREVVEKIMESAGVGKQDTVIEVGPGFGVLTMALAEKAGQVISYEIEKKLEEYWLPLLENNKNLEIIWGNILKTDIQEKKYKLVSNIPYQITSDIIRKFLEAENKPESMVLMVQKEVAERICARPGDMSVLAISVQCYARPEIVAVIPRADFWPEPGVDSAIIKIVPIKKQAPNNVNFFKIVKAGFANKRKYLIKNLQGITGKKSKDDLGKIFAAMNLNPMARAQELSVEQWQQLSTYLSGIDVV